MPRARADAFTRARPRPSRRARSASGTGPAGPVLGAVAAAAAIAAGLVNVKKIASQKDARTVEKETSDVKQADEDLSLSADTSADTSSSSTSSFVSSVKDTINQLITVFKNFFASLWNGSGKSSDITDSDDKAAALSSDDLSDTDSTDIMPANENVLSETEDVIDLPKTDDLDSIKSYLNDYNGHRLARNSSLLTSYDRFGRLVEPGVSDKDKILRGDSESLMNQLRRKK